MKKRGVADDDGAFLGIRGGHQCHAVIALKDEFKVANPPGVDPQGEGVYGAINH